MVQNRKYNIAQFDDNIMYDVNDVLKCFKYLGKNTTFREMLDFFGNAQIISKNIIDDYIKNNVDEICDIRFRLMTEIAVEHIPTEYALYIEKHKEWYKKRSSAISEEIIKARIVDYNYFKEIIDRLKTKGLTYLCLISYIADSEKNYSDRAESENLLVNSQIEIEGTKMNGADLKRLLSVVFNCQTELENYLTTANKLATYNQSYLNFEQRVDAIYEDEGLYPVSDLLFAPNYINNYGVEDDTLIKTKTRRNSKGLVKIKALNSAIL